MIRTLVDPACTLENGAFTFERTLKSLRNIVILPSEWPIRHAGRWRLCGPGSTIAR